MDLYYEDLYEYNLCLNCIDYLCLVCIDPNSTEPKVYGVVSWGYEPCGTPGFYAKTSTVIDWFDDVITGKYPPDPCDGGVCQMPEDVFSPGNYWFTNDLSNNYTARNRRDVVLEDGEIAREASWPWVVGITGSPKPDYCHVQIVSKNYLCGSRDITVRYAEFSDLNIVEIQEMNEKIFRRLRQDFLTHLLIKYFMKYARGLP